MTLINRMLSRASLSLATVTLAAQFVVPSAYALEKDQVKQALDQIHQATINSYYSVNGFYNFSANQGDQQQLNVINESISTIDGLITSLEGTLDTGATADSFKSTQDSWSAYQSVMNENIDVVVDTGYPDLRLAGDMATTNIDFNAALKGLYTNVTNSSDFKPSSTTAKSRKAATMIALMMTKYSARSTSTVSQVYTGGDTEITIDSLAKEFDKLIAELTDIAKDNETAADLIDSAKTKWEFIRSSLINYNENRVNFIVNLYSKKIINDIESASGNL